MSLCFVCGQIVATVRCYDGAPRCLPCAAQDGFEWRPGDPRQEIAAPPAPAHGFQSRKQILAAMQEVGPGAERLPPVEHAGHQLDHSDHRWHCRRCTWSWRTRPTLACPGVPRYAWGAWPAHCRTRTQLHQAGLQPGGAAIGCYYRARDNARSQPWLWLYDTRTATARPCRTGSPLAAP